MQRGINADIWEDMKGDLPCLNASESCIIQLQNKAVNENPLLTDLDRKIEEINDRIEDARRDNKRSVNLSVLTPGVRYIFEGAGARGEQPQGQRQPGAIDRILGLFTGLTGINNLLGVIGVPVFQALTGSTPGVQQNNIAIADLQTKVAALVSDRAQLANRVKERVAEEVFEFDVAAREFQLSQEIARRESDRFQLLDVEYRLGQGSTQSYLGNLTALDAKKAATFRSWTAMRRRINQIKLLVLGED
ncbi:MAG: hypothetical protein LRZ84_22820 [Desertifilum sp.]|nr:hypothetical protein [Desertifilum sp.]